MGKQRLKKKKLDRHPPVWYTRIGTEDCPKVESRKYKMSVIFDDLGIDYSKMMSDPEDFDTQCLAAAERLREILRADNSVETFIKTAEDTYKGWGKFDTFLQDLYEISDEEMPVGSLLVFANKLKKLAKEIEYMARDKATYEIANDVTFDKSVAFDMYKDLRVKHGQWVDAMELLGLYQTNKMPAMPGNYGRNAALSRWVFIVEGEDIPYRTHDGIIRRLIKDGYDLDRGMKLMDLVDFLQANPGLGIKATKVEVS